MNSEWQHSLFSLSNIVSINHNYRYRWCRGMFGYSYLMSRRHCYYKNYHVMQIWSKLVYSSSYRIAEIVLTIWSFTLHGPFLEPCHQYYDDVHTDTHTHTDNAWKHVVNKDHQQSFQILWHMYIHVLVLLCTITTVSWHVK